MTCLRCACESELIVCDLCYDRLTPLLQKKVSEGSSIPLAPNFFRYLDRLNELARPA